MSICELMNAHVRYKVENDADSITYEINDFSCTYVAHQLQQVTTVASNRDEPWQS